MRPVLLRQGEPGTPHYAWWNRGMSLLIITHVMIYPRSIMHMHIYCYLAGGSAYLLEISGASVECVSFLTCVGFGIFFWRSLVRRSSCWQLTFTVRSQVISIPAECWSGLDTVCRAGLQRDTCNMWGEGFSPVVRGQNGSKVKVECIRRIWFSNTELSGCDSEPCRS